jgi:hypothetical protein
MYVCMYVCMYVLYNVSAYAFVLKHDLRSGDITEESFHGRVSGKEPAHAAKDAYRVDHRRGSDRRGPNLLGPTRGTGV